MFPTAVMEANFTNIELSKNTISWFALMKLKSLIYINGINPPLNIKKHVVTPINPADNILYFLDSKPALNIIKTLYKTAKNDNNKK